MYEIGERPGKGTFCCTNCNEWAVTITNKKHRLPACQKCGGGQRVKYWKLKGLELKRWESASLSL